MGAATRYDLGAFVAASVVFSTGGDVFDDASQALLM